MTNPNEPDPRDYDKHSDVIGGILKYIAGLLFGFVVMFVPTFIGGAASFEQNPVWWGMPLVALVAIPVAIGAWMTGRRNPSTSAGIWTGLALGVLLAGACFFGT